MNKLPKSKELTITNALGTCRNGHLLGGWRHDLFGLKNEVVGMMQLDVYEFKEDLGSSTKSQWVALAGQPIGWLPILGNSEQSEVGR